MFLQNFSFLCFASFVVQNLPALGRKTEKNKEIALPQIISYIILYYIFLYSYEAEFI
jgi:hypothetical protein